MLRLDMILLPCSYFSSTENPLNQQGQGNAEQCAERIGSEIGPIGTPCKEFALHQLNEPGKYDTRNRHPYPILSRGTQP